MHCNVMWTNLLLLRFIQVTEELLAHAFSKYPSRQKTKIIRNKFNNKSKGYGFVSFSDPYDAAKALKEMHRQYIGNRPCKISKSCWQDRNIKNVRRKQRKEKKFNPFTVAVQSSADQSSGSKREIRMFKDLF